MFLLNCMVLGVYIGVFEGAESIAAIYFIYKGQHSAVTLTTPFVSSRERGKILNYLFKINVFTEYDGTWSLHIGF